MYMHMHTHVLMCIEHTIESCDVTFHIIDIDTDTDTDTDAVTDTDTIPTQTQT